MRIDICEQTAPARGQIYERVSFFSHSRADPKLRASALEIRGSRGTFSLTRSQTILAYQPRVAP